MNILNASSIPLQSQIGLQDSVTPDRTGAESFLQQLSATDSQPESAQEADELKKTFRQFVGNTLYGQMLKSMRSTLDKPAYMHGGKTEEIFQQQLDQIMVEDLTEKSAATIADPMLELFNMRRAG